MKTVLNFLENSRSKSRFATGINDTGGYLPPVSTTPAANFATGVNNTGGKLPTVYQRHRRQICHTGGK
jgi:hypothetical protein